MGRRHLFSLSNDGDDEEENNDAKEHANCTADLGAYKSFGSRVLKTEKGLTETELILTARSVTAPMAPSVKPISEYIMKENGDSKSIFIDNFTSEERQVCFNCEIRHRHFPMKITELIDGTRRSFCSLECMKIARIYNLAPRVKDTVERRWAVSKPLPNRELYKNFFQDEIVESRENLPYSEIGDQNSYPLSDTDVQVEGQYAEDIKFFVLEKERRFRALKRRMRKRRRVVADGIELTLMGKHCKLAPEHHHLWLLAHERKDGVVEKQIKVPKKARRLRPRRAVVMSKFVVPTKARHNCDLVVVQTVE
mmetsp:Transcript_4863/g.6865  ORF Transcript_4863/g.6865 Transcript_4863/m.6865 type:complete len:308 (+) Transcript_4863:2344-3267(+)